MLGATVLSFCVLLGRSYVLCEVLTLHVAVMYWNQTGEPSSTNHSLGCATLAEKDLRTAGLLPAELEFVYHTFNSKWPGVCLLDKRGGIVATVDFYYNHNVSAFIGPFCSSEQTTAAQLAKVWNLPIVRFQATSPVLKDKAVFSTLAGMNPADSAEFAAAHTVLLHKWGYTRVAMFYTDYIAVQIRMQGMREELTAGGFNVTVDAEVKEDSTYEEILQSDHLKTIRENSRVLLISMGKPVGMNIRLLKALDTLNMTYKNGYLILMNQVTPGWHLDPWNDPIMLEYGDVTKEECRRLFSYTITFELKDLTVASMQAFFDRVREHAGSSPESSDAMGMVMPIYDAFYLYGQALGGVLRERNISLQNARDGAEIWNRMKNARFNGSIGETFTDVWADKVNAFTVYVTDAPTVDLPTAFSYLIPTADPHCERHPPQAGPHAPSCYILVAQEVVRFSGDSLAGVAHLVATDAMKADMFRRLKNTMWT